ncbi:hypothetical protein [Bombella apis]|uniref:hypothetical protein n=1 Tax=Bombella apis TaxID=1785988 RepID=UPI0023F36559|nr:hypothetical protein [Bombella apis]MCT6819424.1 hypothetical protein [Bombella apis]MCT6845701.1 hypothetical protein [Bombella apis]
MKPARLKALTSLLTLQKRNTTLARTELAHCLAEEKRLENSISELKAQMQENRILVSQAREEEAQDLTLWNGYRYWLPTAQEEMDRLEQALDNARAVSTAARGRVMDCVRAQEATDGLLRQDRLEQADRLRQQEQVALDERAQHQKMLEELEL